MLVLTRKVGEAILIGADIVVRVSAIDGGRVRIGVEARLVAAMQVRILPGSFLTCS